MYIIIALKNDISLILSVSSLREILWTVISTAKNCLIISRLMRLVYDYNIIIDYTCNTQMSYLEQILQ